MIDIVNGPVKGVELGTVRHFERLLPIAGRLALEGPYPERAQRMLRESRAVSSAHSCDKAEGPFFLEDFEAVGLYRAITNKDRYTRLYEAYVRDPETTKIVATRAQMSEAARDQHADELRTALGRLGLIAPDDHAPDAELDVTGYLDLEQAKIHALSVLGAMKIAA